MSHTISLLARRHPLTGEPIRPIGHRPDGRPVWPIMGASEDDQTPPERPDDVPEGEWDALGDPGRQALVRERAKVAELERKLAAAKARPAPPKRNDPPPASPARGDDAPDIAAIVQSAVDAAIKPFAEREEQRQAEDAAHRVRDAVVAAAKPRLHDGTDGLMIDLTAVVDDDGAPDAAKITAALDDLIKEKPHLAKDTRRFGGSFVGASDGGAEPPLKERVQAVLADMQAATGIRAPKGA